MKSQVKATKTARKFSRPSVPTSTEINKNWIVKFRASDDKPGWNKLMGAGQYEKKFGAHYRDLHFTKAMESAENRIEFRIRGKYIITFFAR